MSSNLVPALNVDGTIPMYLRKYFFPKEFHNINNTIKYLTLLNAGNSSLYESKVLCTSIKVCFLLFYCLFSWTKAGQHLPTNLVFPR